MRRPALLTALALGLVQASACTIATIPLEGRVCVTSVDCISGYVCSADRICVPLPDSGRIDAGRDAFSLDVTRDAFRTSDAGPDTALPDAFIDPDAFIEPDASAPDAFAPDAVSVPDAFVEPDAFTVPDAFVTPDAFSVPDAFVTPDAFTEPDALTALDAH